MISGIQRRQQIRTGSSSGNRKLLLLTDHLHGIIQQIAALTANMGCVTHLCRIGKAAHIAAFQRGNPQHCHYFRNDGCPLIFPEKLRCKSGCLRICFLRISGKIRSTQIVAIKK